MVFLTHVEFQQFFHCVRLAQSYLFQTHILTDKVLEFVR